MRCLAISATLIAFAASTSTATLAEVISGTAFSSGNWEGAAETDANGAFSNCYATVGFVSGETLWFSLYPNNTLTLYASSPSVPRTPGQEMETQVMVETVFPWTGVATAVDQSYVALDFANLDEATDFLTQGSYLRMIGVGMDQAFEVRGLGGALAQARGCLAKQQATAMAGGNPAPAAPAGLKPILGTGGATTPVTQMRRPEGLAGPTTAP